MKTKTITYQRVKNLGNYETERLEMTVELAEEESGVEAAKALIETVNQILFPPKKEEPF